MSNVIPFDPSIRQEQCCSFCKRPQSQVKRLVSNGQDGAELRCICSDCLATAKQRLQEAA